MIPLVYVPITSKGQKRKDDGLFVQKGSLFGSG